jgi:hypothetical protein
MDIDAINSTIYIMQTAATIGKWYQMSAWIKADSGTPTMLYAGIQRAFTISSTYTQYYISGRAVEAWQAIYALVAAGRLLYIDDTSMKEISSGTQYNLLNAGAGVVDVSVSAAVIVPAADIGGVIVCANAGTNPASYIAGYTNSNNIYLVKYVAGTVTQLIAEAIAYVDSKIVKVVKTGTDVALYYDDVQIGATQTVADAEIVSNTYHGMIATRTASIGAFLLAAP